ncbi:isocitrate/isopropylmalate dehydrogenase family protein [Paralimibaculum aggregatum]|uniref:Isocitrate/isopropylmalate dehydrogenase family protein n=1 Tax=Paralimibaculum aggregatum TaxID=3036245 RepID=A0ABQ6LPW4_9RHOB|nr:isocitrate/isopropylmalate family dehydrogenase [Limibaculum sp. NKW23]GMG84609.1 isocitrate/isopropylmalate dehydrogenase family protein [Limibaculum sp. NKW23]
MSSNSGFRVAVFPGDGIGAEITEPTLRLIERAAARAGAPLPDWSHCDAGAVHYRDHGTALPKRSIATADAADAILLAAMGLPAVRYPDGREITPQIDLRMEFGLYAGVRPVKPIPGVRRVLADPRAHDIDYVILRESTEGLFAPQAPGTRDGDREARETMVITRPICEKLFDFAFRLADARGGQRKVTSVDKANVFGAFAFWREVFEARAAAHPGIGAESVYVDAFAMTMVQKPWSIDVAVTENMFGDILSDLGAALMGGMGYAPSADIGDTHAVFQPCHGSAPDIAGKGLANPTAMILSAAMMLDWLGTRHASRETARAGALLRAAVEAAFAPGRLVTCELGGDAGTAQVFAAVGDALERQDA